MARQGYVTFALPAELVSSMDRWIAANEWGYRSRAELLSAAVREFLERHPPRPPYPDPQAKK